MKRLLAFVGVWCFAVGISGCEPLGSPGSDALGSSDGGGDFGGEGRADVPSPGSLDGAPDRDALTADRLLDGSGGDGPVDSGGPDADVHLAADDGVPPCLTDGNCGATEYCSGDGICRPGCRTMAADNCPPDLTGHPRACNVDSRDCLPVAACCAADASCSLTPVDACNGITLEGALSCRQDPCGTRCLAHTDCSADRYCHPVDFLCAVGCREGVHGACPPDQACHRETQTCDFIACQVEGDCSDPEQYCDRLGAMASDLCLDGCRSDAVCPAGARCGANHVCIFQCDAANADCPPGTFCDGASGRCLGACFDDSDCALDEICDLELEQCVPGCREDEFEPDDLVDQAHVLMLSDPGADGLRTALAFGRVCDFNPDVFAVRLPAGSRLRVRLDFAAGSVLYAGLFAEGQDDSFEVALVESPSSLFFPAIGAMLPELTVYLRVHGDVIPGVGYDLEVAVSPPGEGCFSDEREPGDSRPAGATRLAVMEQSFQGAICRADEDWFVRRMGRDHGLRLKVVSLAGGGPLIAELYRVGGLGALALPAPDYVTEATLVDGEGASFELDLPADSSRFSDEDWFIRVRGASPDGEADYRMEVIHRPGSGQCGDDGRTEPNDEVGLAVALDDLPELSEGARLRPDVDHLVPIDTALCVADLDVFCLLADLDDGLAASVVSAAAMSLVWLDGLGDPVTAPTPSNLPLVEPRRVARLGRATPGRYCVQVYGAPGPYTLNVRRSPAGAFECAADQDETDPLTGRRNDTAAFSTLVPAIGFDTTHFTIDSGYLCDIGGATDEDWYQFVPPILPARLCISVDGFTESGADVDVELYLPGGADNAVFCERDAECGLDGLRCVDHECVASAESARTGEAVEIIARPRSAPVPLTGEHYLRVLRGEPPGAGVPYRINVTAQSSSANGCAPDWREALRPNDAQADAIFLGRGPAALCDAWLCPEEQAGGDWYRITVPPGDDRSVMVTYDGDHEGRLFIYGFGPQTDAGDLLSGLVRSELLAGDVQCLNLRGGDAEQTFEFQVYGDRISQDRLDYSLRLARTRLDASAVGACVTLGGPDLPACPPRAEWEEFPGFGRLQPTGCYAELALP